MENASKALIMAAGVLLGIMLLSIAVYLFSIFGGFSSNISNKLAEKEISEFNAQFLKYQSYKTSGLGDWQNLCRVHDIITVANLAKENNLKYEYTATNKGPYYINVQAKMIKPHLVKNISDLEQREEDEYKELIKEFSLVENTLNPFFYKCTVFINEDTKLVNKIIFTLPYSNIK